MRYKVQALVRVDGVEYTIREAILLHPCNVTREAMRWRLYVRPICTSAWLTRPMKPVARERVPARSKLLDVYGSRLTFARAARYIARLSQRQTIVVARANNELSITPQAHAKPCRHDVGTYWRASPAAVLRDLAA